MKRLWRRLYHGEDIWIGKDGGGGDRDNGIVRIKEPMIIIQLSTVRCVRVVKYVGIWVLIVYLGKLTYI